MAHEWTGRGRRCVCDSVWSYFATHLAILEIVRRGWVGLAKVLMMVKSMVGARGGRLGRLGCVSAVGLALGGR